MVLGGDQLSWTQRGTLDHTLHQSGSHVEAIFYPCVSALLTQCGLLLSPDVWGVVLALVGQGQFSRERGSSELLSVNSSSPAKGTWAGQHLLHTCSHTYTYVCAHIYTCTHVHKYTHAGKRLKEFTQNW